MLQGINRNTKRILRERQITQSHIIQHFGQPALDHKKQELCTNCIWCIPNDFALALCKKLLIPITLKGEDCPYFKQQQELVDEQ